MKHAVKQRKSAAQPKTKSLAPVKNATKIKPAIKKTVGEVASNPRSLKAVQKTKAVAKTAPKTLKISAKTPLPKNAPKLPAKTLSALKTISNRKPEFLVKQIEKPKKKKIASKLPAKSAKIVEPKTAVKKNKSTAQTGKLVAPAKKAVVGKKVTKPAATKPKPALKTANAKPKSAVKTTVKTAVKTVKPKTAKTNIQKAKPRLPKAATVSTAKEKNISQKAKLISKARKPQKVEKTILAAKPVKTKKIAATTDKAKTLKRKPEKIQIVEPNKPGKKTTATRLSVEPKKVIAKKLAVKAIKTQSIIAPKKVVEKTEKFTPAVEATENVVWKRLKFKPAISSAKTIKATARIKKEAAVEKIEPVVIIETVKPRPPKQKKGKPISSAVFRGKKERYDFKVFELNDIFEPIPAVYIISKRKTDRNKRGHHALICIGETASIADEIKRHRKGKCVKKHAANVVSILPEADAKMRLRIETDLKAAHSVACNFE